MTPKAYEISQVSGRRFGHKSYENHISTQPYKVNKGHQGN